MAQFPSKEIAQLSYEYRTLGLGYANIGGLLMAMGLAYDSMEGRAMAGVLSAIMTGVAYRTSAEMAREMGPFLRYEENARLDEPVMHNHCLAAERTTEFEGRVDRARRSSAGNGVPQEGVRRVRQLRSGLRLSISAQHTAIAMLRPRSSRQPARSAC